MQLGFTGSNMRKKNNCLKGEKRRRSKVYRVKKEEGELGFKQ